LENNIEVNISRRKKRNLLPFSNIPKSVNY
jgi:hypothetical protein